MYFNKLVQLNTEFKNGNISKEDYIEKMHDVHKILFDYTEFIKNTDIKRIIIDDDILKMVSRERKITLICDQKDHRSIPLEILNFNNYEKIEIEFILKLVKNCHCILDIGANVGWYSINISKENKNAEIFAFEPIPQTFKYLSENIEKNNVTNIKIFNYGFSDEEKYLNFYHYPEGPGNSSSRNLSGREDINKIVCKVRKLDDFVAEKKLNLDFIKCDVEGAELFVLKGGIKTLKTDKPIIFIELLRKWAKFFEYHPNDIIELLKELGYRCFTIKEDYLVEFYQMDDNSLETNFIFLHQEKNSDLINQYVR